MKPQPDRKVDGLSKSSSPFSTKQTDAHSSKTEADYFSNVQQEKIDYAPNTSMISRNRIMSMVVAVIWGISFSCWSCSDKGKVSTQHTVEGQNTMASENSDLLKDSSAVADVKQLKAAPAAQAQESATAKQESDFKQCAEMLAEFTHKYPNPTLTERIEGYYLVAQCQEKMGQLDDAMLSYAKAATVGGDLVETATATKAKEKLERLYKVTHNGILVGIEKVYKKAKDSIAETEK